MNKKETLNNLIIGSLLHDIGKVIQRADDKSKSKSHQEFGYDYIKEKLNGLSDEILECIKYHHDSNTTKEDLRTLQKGKNHIVQIVNKADNIAAAIDRKNYKEKDKNDWGNDAILESVFYNINNEELKTIANIENIEESKINKFKNTYKGYYLRDFSNESLINYPVSCKNKASKNVYQEIKNKFTDDIQQIDSNNINSYLKLTEKYFTYVLSSTNLNQLPDISLYDHSKLTAAIASCIYLYFKENNITDYTRYGEEVEYFLLVNGDLSGIQEFIYNIASKKALKSLRARSFYLEILIEHIIDEILEQLDLSRANVLFTGGGHFSLLLPKTKETADLIDKAKESVNQWLHKNFSIGLYLNIACQEANSKDLKHNYSKTYGLVKEKISKEKLQRYSYSKKILKDVLTKSNIEDLEKESAECKACGNSNVKLENDGEDIKCINCINFAKLGEKLFDSFENFYINTSIDSTENNIELPSIIDEKEKYFLSFDEKDNAKRTYSKNIIKIDEDSINLWLADYFKEDKKEFKKLAEQSIGSNKLAVLRADVDSLGNSFSSGFPDKYRTISRYAALSRQLSLFFKFYIKRVCEGKTQGEKNKYDDSSENDIKKSCITYQQNEKKNMVIVYSGGDDVFAIGAWNDILDFAIDLRETFKKFTCGNLTFSAGIGFFNHSFPVYQMAKLTGKLEELAKENKFIKNNQEFKKDSISLFGVDSSIYQEKENQAYTHSWDEFIEKVYKKK